MKISRSVSQKLSMKEYGGNQYEMSEVFSAREEECDPKDADKISERLFKECLNDVERDKRHIIQSIEPFKDNHFNQHGQAI
jgi:hypothetical protein